MDAVEAARAIGAECLCFRARRVARVLTRIYDDALRPLGLQSTQLTLLSIIVTGGDEGRPMAKIAEVMAMDPTTLSRNLRPLERAGWVHIERDARDRRVRVARLTEAGREMLTRALPFWRRAHAQVLATLGPDAAAGLRDRFDHTAVEAGSILEAA